MTETESIQKNLVRIALITLLIFSLGRYALDGFILPLLGYDEPNGLDWQTFYIAAYLTREAWLQGVPFYVRDELPPAVALRGENLLPGWREPVVAAATLPRLLHPSATNPAALLQSIKQRIKRSDVEAKRAAGTHLDQLPDVIAVTRTVFD